PTTLQEVANHMETLGPLSDRLNVVFVSVDPERDTPEVLKDYLSNFDSRIIGLTGSASEIASVAAKYKAYYARVDSDGEFTYDHSASVYLMDADGKLADTFAFKDPDALKLKKLKALVAG
ncbi:MAG: SCO family protein, partial [Pseudomonadota bacterium]